MNITLVLLLALSSSQRFVVMGLHVDDAKRDGKGSEFAGVWSVEVDAPNKSEAERMGRDPLPNLSGIRSSTEEAPRCRGLASCFPRSVRFILDRSQLGNEAAIALSRSQSAWSPDDESPRGFADRKVSGWKL